MLKYIGYYAELPLGLPKSMEDQIIQDMQKENLSQGGQARICDMLWSDHACLICEWSTYHIGFLMDVP